MFLRIETLKEKKLIGMHLRMSMANNKTFELWKNFMLRRNEIKNNLTSDFISMQLYDSSYDLNNFNPAEIFEKWAAIEVSDFKNIPDGMENFILPSGPYAVFLHQGDASTAAQTFQYIFGTWLPNSEYALDNRPHFEILGEKYKNNDPNSEEKIWMPVKLKGIKN
jgi:AraC family transcriptional regulator